MTQKVIITLDETDNKSFTLDIDFEPKIGTREDFMGTDHTSKRLANAAAAIVQIITQKLPEILAQKAGK